jgi:hypothetical protein
VAAIQLALGDFNMSLFSRRLQSWLIAFCIACTCLSAWPFAAPATNIYAPGGGSIRALIVGIDTYATVRHLKGAVADARDLASSLGNAGVPKENIELILDGAATRTRLLAEMRRLVEVSNAGDLVVVAFAGHGGRVKEMYPNTKLDHMDEAYILAKFDAKVAAGAREILAGPEIKHWIGLLDAKSVDVLFIADTCHGGGLTRTPALGEDQLSYRIIVSDYAKAEANAYSTAEDAGRAEASYPRLTFLAAVDPTHKAPEVPIDGQPTLRGALSYAVARAIEGAAGGERKGVLTREALIEYARQTVSHYADMQVIYTRPKQSDKLGAPVFRTAGAAVPNAVVSVDISFDRKPLRVAIINGKGSELSGVQKRAAPFVISGKDDADIIWDPKKRLAYAGGDVLARDVDAADIPAVVDRIAATRLLQRLADDRPQSFRLLPDNSLHKEGDKLTLQADGVAGKYLIAFNITGDGLVQYLFPSPREPARVPDAAWQVTDIRVVDHFGSDQVVVIVSPTRLSDLEEALRKFDKTRNAGTVPGLLKAFLDKDRNVRIGLVTIVTAPEQ